MEHVMWNFLTRHSFLFLFKKISVKFTYHKTYYFKMDSSVVLSILTKLCNDHHFLIPEYSHHPQRNSMLT